MLRLCFFVLFFVLFQSGMYAQKSIEKYGKVSKEVLELKQFPADTTMDAVILFDVGKYQITNQFELMFERHIRIKLFTKEGEKYAEQKIRIGRGEKLLELDAQTILPDGSKIEVKDYYDEKISDFYSAKKFAFPAVAPGAVLEVKYSTIEDHLMTLPTWSFQNNLYTLLSKLEITIIPGFKYSVNYINPFAYNMEPQKTEIVSGETRYEWTLSDIPAFAEEDYMAFPGDGKTQVTFQLMSFENRYQKVDFVKSWDDLSNDVYEYNYEITKFRNADDLIKEIVQSKTKGTESNEQKLRILYEFVRDSIETKNSGYLFVSKTAKDVLKSGSGRDVEKEYLLAYLLEYAGFSPELMMIATRDYGRINPFVPQLSHFNKVIVYVKDGLNKYLMTASDPFAPFGVISPDCLSDRGLPVKKTGGTLIALPKIYKKHKVSVKNQFQLDGNSLTGISKLTYKDIAARNYRITLKNKKLKEYYTNKLKKIFHDVTVENVEVKNLNNLNQDLVITLTYQVNNFGQINGNMIYLETPWFISVNSNPFDEEKRVSDIDFKVKREFSEKSEFIIKGGYKIEELPAGRIHKNADFYYKSKFTATATGFTCSKKFKIKNTYFKKMHYSYLKEYFSELENLDENEVVLKKGPLE